MIAPDTLSKRVLLEDLPELNDILLKLRRVRLWISSASMAPALRPGDEIVVEPVQAKALQPGDLLLFRHNGQLICHRLIEVSPSLLRTRGDAMEGPGENVAFDQVLGKVVNVRRRTFWVGLNADVAHALMPVAVACLGSLQKLKPYKLLMQPLVRPFLSYHVGLPQGLYQHRWQRVDSPTELPRLEASVRPPLLLARCGSGVAGWTSLVFRDSAWSCEQVTVRIRYRGLGIESVLAAWAHRLAAAQQRADT